ncbi:MAG: site-specific DNA-methyltransferase [Acetobacteraceae bacterium]|nr:site-specific DNA-methyltransferase [Acetobacteraceae bacterium]MSP29691.1 site-specific DNA-methyltransferase [Acetobacteraceae bacterium]
MAHAPPDPVLANALHVGPHRLILGDCLGALANLPAESVDVVVTSPPYNLGIAYGRHDDRMAEAEYLAWMTQVGAAIRRVMRPDGSFFLNIAGSSTRPWLPMELICRLRPLFVLQNNITWVKSIAIGADSTGHYKPVPGKRFLHHNHESLFHLTLHGDVQLNRLAIGVPFKDKSNIARRGHAQDLRCRGDTWFIPYRTVKSKAQKFHHPSTFPEDLPRWCIRLHGRANPVVLDPFMGTGTTLVAAAREGGHGIGIDLDPIYVETAQTRLLETFPDLVDIARR